MEDVNYTMIMCVYCVYFYRCFYTLSRIGKFAMYILSHGRQYILCVCMCVEGCVRVYVSVCICGYMCASVLVYVCVAVCIVVINCLTYFYLSLLLLVSLLYLFERVYYKMGNKRVKKKWGLGLGRTQ